MHHILIIEDDDLLALALTMALRSLPHVTVHYAPDGEQGLAAAALRRPDLIILDYMLPGHSGLEVTAELRRQGLGLPILMMTAYDAPLLRQAARETGVTELMAKPFLVDEVLNVCAFLLATVSEQAVAAG
ncbi:MAG TPA: response regulator [Herpetosiphonaceae bacterium]